jgi:hypothetical protein
VANSGKPRTPCRDPARFLAPSSRSTTADASTVFVYFLKQPFELVHGGKPYCARYTARSLSAFGSSNASTMATVCPEPAVVEGRPYAA